MASNALDFQCPQFVDFAAELDSSDVDDMFFDCKDHITPEVETYDNLEDNVFAEKHVTSEEENRLLNQLEASLSVLRNTPKLKMGSVRGKLLVERFCKSVCPEAKPILKPKTAPPPAVNLVRSKSVACFNKILARNPSKVKGFRKRSSSLNDLKPQLIKKQNYPLTPMCLKRTIIKSKNKVKTTEERELEEIAKLQKQLIQHLRDNEITLKRLKLKPKPSIFTKNADAKINKGLSSQLGRINEKKTRRNIQKVNSADLKKEVMKVDAIMKNQPGGSTMTDKQVMKVAAIMKNQSGGSKMAEKEEKENDARKSKYPSTSVVSDMKEENKTRVTKTVHSKKLGFHSGLVFHDILNKNTPNKSFTFDVKSRERINSAKPEFKIGVPLLNSVVKSRMDGKENIPQSKACSTVKKTKMQNSNCDIVKQMQINKKNFDRLVKNPIKGLPLSDKLVRNKC